jgi:hypothetical protein
MVVAEDQDEECLEHSKESASRLQNEAHEDHACEDRPVELHMQYLAE